MFEDREFWIFINTFASWFSALGTIAAVIVSLYLARRDSRIRLKVEVGIRRILQRGVDRPVYFSIDVTNIGRRSAQIVSLYMRDGVYFSVKSFQVGKRMVMMPPDDALSARVPTTISDGEHANYLIPWPEFERKNRAQIRGLFGGPLGRIRARLFHVGVVTSAEGTFYARIEKGLAESLVRTARAETGGIDGGTPNDHQR